MSAKATSLMQAALKALHLTGLAAALAPVARGRGVIFTMHSVSPEPPRPFEPNRILKITPDFLDIAITTVKRCGYDIVSLDEAARRLDGDNATRPFACFTLDDGYRDNRDHAYPVFKRHNAPFAIYVPTAFADGEGDLWWYALEAAIAKADRIRVHLEGHDRVFETVTDEAKDDAFDQIYWILRAGPETEMRACIAAIAADAGYDPSPLCRNLIMDWDELRDLAADPLVTIGSHTCRHFAIAKLPEDVARAEIAGGVARIERELNRPCRHFSFPYGDSASAGPRDFAIARSLGLETAVTTHKHVVRTSSDRFGLPRISLNGDYQEARYVEVMMTGVPFALFDAAGATVRRVKQVFGLKRPEARPASRSRVRALHPFDEPHRRQHP
jgi:peptidoglycan/xylan/chitin deacetylase (PgdA/CDA1 family)